MKMIELTGAKGGAVWVNPAQVLYAAAEDGGGGSMYGDNNVRAAVKLHFNQGAGVEVRESMAEVVSRLGG